jgi:hypothetical protein
VGVSDRLLAQIVADNTLGAERSVVTPNVFIRGIPSDRIDGGATRGANLFHSFQEFNVGEGRGAYVATAISQTRLELDSVGNDSLIGNSSFPVAIKSVVSTRYLVKLRDRATTKGCCKQGLGGWGDGESSK